MNARSKRYALPVLSGVVLSSMLFYLSDDSIGAPINLVQNPSVENGTAVPNSWQKGRWGANTVTYTYPEAGLAGTKSVRVDMTAHTDGDAKWYFSEVAVKPSTKYVFSNKYISNVSTTYTIQYKNTSGAFSYAALGTVPAVPSATQKQFTFTTPANAVAMTVFHHINAVGYLITDDYSLMEETAVADTVSPSTSILAPGNGNEVSGIVAVNASASDNVGVVGVSLLVDGAVIGAEDLSSPYEFSLDTRAFSNGSHSLAARARDAAGNIGTSTPVNVSINNSVSGSNLIQNDSLETAGTNGNPLSWMRGGWGQNTPVFTYPVTGQQGAKAAKLEITSYVSGDAKWYFSEVPVTAGAIYNFKDMYRSTVASSLVAQFAVSGGYQYQFIADLPVAANWTETNYNITVPAGAAKMTVFHLLSSVGTLETDAFSLMSNSADLTAPSVNITSPVPLSTISGTVTVNASSTDNVAVAEVELFVDGAPAGVKDISSPYAFVIDTAAFSNGSHTLLAKAKDTSGNIGSSEGVSVTVSNTPSGTPGFEAQTIAGGLMLPTSMAFSPDGRIFIAEKNGIIRAVKNGALLPNPVITLTDVNTYGDRGLIGIAADPNFIDNGYLYLSYTFENSPGANFSGSKTARIVRVTVIGDEASESSKKILVGSVGGTAGSPSCDNFAVTSDCIPSDSSSHSAGGLRFGPDGKLYASLGEGASFDYVDVRALRSQNLDSLGGKILRINADGTAPSDNPFYNGDPNSNRSKVYAYGMRNTFRFNFRPSDGALFAGDVGWSTWEEINRILPGKNYGWPCKEGNAPTTIAPGGPGYNCQAAGAVDPIYFYQHDQAGAGAVTAGAFPTGSAYPAEYSNSLFFGDFAQNFIRRITLDENNNVLSVREDIIDNPGGPVDLSTGLDGNVYYISIYKGTLERLVYTTGNRNPSAVINASRTSGLAPLSVQFSSEGSSDPNGDALEYRWTFGDGATSNSDSPFHVFSDNGTYSTVLKVTDGKGGVDIKTIKITVGNQSPSAEIVSPASGTLYTSGSPINLRGQGTDAEDGALPASSMHWSIILHHNIHTHVLEEFDGVSAPTFNAPDHGGELDVYTEVLLTVTDSAGLIGTQSINLYLNNGQQSGGGNLIKNGSMETVDPNAAERPLYWMSDFYGSMSQKFTYPVAGLDGMSAGKVEVSNYVSGSAKWYHDPVFVTPGAEYDFSGYYTSTADTDLIAEFGFANGTYDYVFLDSIPPAASPTQIKKTIAIPANVQRLSVIQELVGNGTLITDNYSLTLKQSDPGGGEINLISNGTFEEVAANGDPSGWFRGAWGSQTTSYFYPVEGRNGGKAASVAITSYPESGGGDSKWSFAGIPVESGTRYTYSDWYKAGDISDVIGGYVMTNGQEHYFGVAKELVPTDTWKAATGSFCPPVGVSTVSLYHIISSETTLSVDDVSLTAGGSCTPAETTAPSVAFTDPLEGQTVSGVVTLQAAATDESGVSNFFFAVDGIPLGENYPTGPYTIQWDTTTVPNGTHTLKATATDPHGNNDRQIISVIVNN
ncbi:MAG: PQQ-dependent sugar dehydrogenase [Candidatus Pacebacteria bacterium]|nr:PQQ-dependent sugar dehydrogenase [Candidatus Paceibacterota bacterium]